MENKRLLNFEDIVLNEEHTCEESRRKIGVWFSKFEKAIDLLLKLNYFIDVPAKTEETPAGYLGYFIHHKYLEAPYSLHVCNSLLERGYYLNALIQLRSLLDYFVSCRFFYKNPQYVMPYMKGEKCLNGNKGYIGTSHIYNEFSGYFYNQYYGTLFSNFAHGKGGEKMFRVNLLSREAGIQLVPTFKIENAFMIINHLVPIIHGYLKHRETFFQGCLKPLTVDLQEKLSETLDWSLKHHLGQVVRHPASKEWMEAMNQVIGISPV